MPHLQRAQELVADLVGADLSVYKENVVRRRLRAQARNAGHADEGAYLDALASAPRATAQDAARELLGQLCAKVSEFFRDPHVFRVLEERLYPELFAVARHGNRNLQVWSAACSRGQEAYSLAMSLALHGGPPERGVRYQVLGTDIDADSVAAARAGIFPERALGGLPPELRARFLVPLPGNCWQVVSSCRRHVQFRSADLLAFGDHPRGVDLLLCRNVLIYLRREVQESLLLALRDALRPGGYLVLGTSETVIGRPWKALEHIDSARRIYRRPPA